MLTAPSLQGRIKQQTWVSVNALRHRRYNDARNGRRPQRRLVEKDARDAAAKNVNEDTNAGGSVGKDHTPSLYEQLFPDQHQQHSANQVDSEVPRLPADPVVSDPVTIPSSPRRDGREHRRPRPGTWQSLRDERRAQGTQTSMLVLRNGSKNLVEEDFKRLIPQGKHLDGWTMEEGDIIRVVPGRDLRDLSRTGYYYLIFSSPLSAFTYQGHATRIHRMATAHTPASVLSAIPPPPGYTIAGMDAHAAIQSFSLTGPTQSLELRQLKPPLPPALEAIVELGGYASLVKRKDRMPYEARLTLEGPQISMSAIKHILVSSARYRGLGWSGGDDLAPKLTKWEAREPRDAPLESSDVDSRVPTETPETSAAPEGSQGSDTSKSQMDQLKRRTAQNVFIAGFTTESAMQSFVHYWHRRSMEWQTSNTTGIDADDLPPVANVEVLW